MLQIVLLIMTRKAAHTPSISRKTPLFGMFLKRSEQLQTAITACVWIELRQILSVLREQTTARSRLSSGRRRIFSRHSGTPSKRFTEWETLSSINSLRIFSRDATSAERNNFNKHYTLQGRVQKGRENLVPFYIDKNCFTVGTPRVCCCIP